MIMNYQICSRCILDNDHIVIAFDAQGICNYCYQFATDAAHDQANGTYTEKRLLEIINEMVTLGQGKKYDCLLGVSGGIDSTYLGYLCHRLNLRPLCVHFDNGWNSELAVANIEKMIRKYRFDLRTYVIDWEEFRDLQRSFFKAAVVDIELLTDHAIFASLFKIATEEEIKFMLNGGNKVSEYLMPPLWNHIKSDALNIYAIQNEFGTVKIKNFPILDPSSESRYAKMGIKWVDMLNYIPYNVEEAKRTLETELGWVAYGWKHFESVFTRFYQGYFLPLRFGFDKRKVHLANLVWSGQISRGRALEGMKQEFYPKEQIEADKEFVLKKLGFSEEEFNQILRSPVRSHYDYPSQFRDPR